MCGIIGQINNEIPINKHLFEQMRDTLTHRGPDGYGTYISDNGKNALGHRRLSLIDLSATGTQPICNENKTIWITVNGEIYNYKKLKEQLISLGHSFYTNTDSETIVHAYEQWGTEVFQRLKGMYAIGIWDDNKKELIIARDRFGIKPIYYYKDDSSFIFASEIKAIIKNPDIPRNINFESFSNYFIYRYIPCPNTIWKNIYKLPPAHYLILKNNQIDIKKYWSLNASSNEIDTYAAINKVNDLISTSVKEHLQADIPVGTFLSGGYDSSALVYYQNLINYLPKTFSIGFKNWNKSEHKFAEIVANKFDTEHYSEIISKDDYDTIDHLMYYYDEPIADISILPTFFVSKLASKKVKAVISGEGADEIFAGYTWHRASKSSLSNKEKAYYFLKNKYAVNDYASAMSMGMFDSTNIHKLINTDLVDNIPKDTFWFYRKHYLSDVSNIKRFQFLDINTFMSELVLTKIDRASMANSLEVRVPFLDHELVEYMFSLNENSYIDKKKKKMLLYENIKDHLPKEILSRKKQGFVGPDKFYMNYNWYKDVIFSGKLISDKIINRNYIKKLINNKDQWRLWKIAVMEIWYSKWV